MTVHPALYPIAQTPLDYLVNHSSDSTGNTEIQRTQGYREQRGHRDTQNTGIERTKRTQGYAEHRDTENKEDTGIQRTQGTQGYRHRDT